MRPYKGNSKREIVFPNITDEDWIDTNQIKEKLHPPTVVRGRHQFNTHSLAKPKPFFIIY